MRDRLALAFRASFALVTIALPLLLATSCARPAACQRNSDCDRAYCFEGECRRDCIDAERDCPAGWVCNVNAQCVPLDQVPPRIDAGDPEDAGDEGGSGGAGGADGGEDVDGSIDAGDEDGSIEDDAGDDADVRDDGGGGSGGVGGDGGSGGRDSGDDLDAGDEDAGDAGEDNAGGEFDGGDDQEGGVVAPTLGLLDLCTSDDECVGDFVCRTMWVGGPRRCTKACTNNAQCMTGTRCETIGAERICVQSDIGKACVQNADCHSICLPNQNYCSSQCTSGADCPNGFGCAVVGGTKMCVKVAIYCDQSDPQAGVCAPQAAACDVGSYLLVQSCTTRCQTDSDCPQRASGLAPWRCNATDKYCDRPSDILGPVPGGAHAEYACTSPYGGNVVNLCADGLQTNVDAWQPIGPPPVNCSANYTTPGYPGDTCIDSCRYQGGCAFGFACAALTSLNGVSRIGVCLPTGSGEVGAPCTKHRDCAFGYCNLTTNKCSRDCSADGICPSGSVCSATGDYVEGIAFKRCE